MAEKVIGSYLEKNPGKSYFEGFQAYRNAQTGSGERQDLNELKTLQKVYSDSVSNPLTPAAQKAKDAALLEGVNAKISQMAGIGSIASGKTMSMADVKTTAASSGKTEQQVIEAAKAVTGRGLLAHVAPRRGGDPAQLVAGAEKARRELGWLPRYPQLEVILQHAWAWHQARHRG